MEDLAQDEKTTDESDTYRRKEKNTEESDIWGENHGWTWHTWRTPLESDTGSKNQKELTLAEKKNHTKNWKTNLNDSKTL